MDEGRKVQRRNAYIVGAILLLLILLAIMVYQIVAINIKNRDLNELNDQIAYYNELKASGAEETEWRKTLEWIVRRAGELGYRFEDDHLIKDD